MSDSPFSSSDGYRGQIVRSLTPVRPLPAPSRRVWMLVPLGLLLAVSAPLVAGERGDLSPYAPLLTWGVTAVQSMMGLWLLALGFREAVPGGNLSRRALALAIALVALLLVGTTVVTNAASPTVVPRGREWQYWTECVAWPMAVGGPFMILAALMAVRAFPTRPAIAGGFCGMSAGLLSDAGWRLTCWISEPLHVIDSHALAIAGLTAAGALLAICADWPRWQRLRSTHGRRSRS